MSFIDELKRRNVFKVGVAYVIVAWLLLQVADVVLNNIEAATWVFQAILLVLVIGFPLSLFFAWAYELTTEGLKKEKDVERLESITHVTGRKLDYLIIAALVLALGYFVVDKFALEPSQQATETGNAETAEKSIAVLPFVNMSDDPGNEYFSDGISEELLNVLIKVKGLRVVSRTSSFAFKGKDISVPDIAKILNVDHVIEGSVRKAGNTVRVTAQLIDVRTDSHLWSETYDRELEDIFAIQDEISAHIVQALKIVLGADEKEAMAHTQRPTENLEAYEHYLRGRYAWQRRGEDNIRRAIDLFEQATKLDPQLARAWSSLAGAHTTLPSYSDASADKHYSQAVSAAQKALMLDDSLAEAYAVLGDMARVDRKWAEAEAHYLRAIVSEPKNSTAHYWYGEFFVMVGRLHDALEQFRIAYQLDPLHPVTNKDLAAVYFFLNDTGNALKYGAASWDLGHSVGLHVLAMTNLHLGEFERAIELAEQLDDIRNYPIVKLFFEAKIDADKKLLFFETLAEHETELRRTFSVPAYVSLDRVDDAYRVVNMNPNPGRFDYLWVIWRPAMAAFRQDPRFAELVTELGLLDYWREYGWPDACQPAGDNLICE